MAGLAVVSLVVLAAACGGPDVSEELVAAEIVALETPDKPIRSGSPATASVRIENTGDEDHTFWIGYSVRDPAGDWYDAPARPTRIAAGEEADAGEILTPPLQTPGSYDSRISVWSDEPGKGSTARRLADVEEVSMFRVSPEREDFDAPELDPNRWKATTRGLGRGGLAPENAGIEDGQLRLALPTGTLNGSEIESADLYGPGFYAARIKVPNAPSSITGFFLYYPPDFASEIDIEIYNDPSGKVLFTTYSGGEQTHTGTMTLPFDPTADFHDYAFFYDEDSITFYADGVPMKEYEGGLPEEDMKLYVNTWFPTWLSGEEPNSDRYTYVDWIEY